MTNGTATEATMTARAYDGMATVRGVNGIQYPISYRVSDTDEQIMANAERFYDQKVARVESRGDVIMRDDIHQANQAIDAAERDLSVARAALAAAATPVDRARAALEVEDCERAWDRARLAHLRAASVRPAKNLSRTKDFAGQSEALGIL